eukprot:TRINITY_DN8073_c0_g1_i3.p2 TRINITY_DN8073_c0_g1~~TRINITY_DN8073_c0_g1_i3.p2  ORF type:complete len:103 (+),score=31.76 TRINITY_DN8073_c0_g1_i3:108-416(+)
MCIRDRSTQSTWDMGRIGHIVHRERHEGSFEIVHLKDAKGHQFATRLSNVFVIGKGNKALVSLPKARGIRLTIMEERDLQSCLLYTSPSPRDLSTSRMPSSA